MRTFFFFMALGAISLVKGNCLTYSWNMLQFKRQLGSLVENEKIAHIHQQKNYLNIEFKKPTLKSQAIYCILNIPYEKSSPIRNTDLHWTFQSLNHSQKQSFTFITRFNQEGKLSNYAIPNEMVEDLSDQFLLQSLAALGTGNLLRFLFSKKYHTKPCLLLRSKLAKSRIDQVFGIPKVTKQSRNSVSLFFDYQLNIGLGNPKRTLKSFAVSVAFSLDPETLRLKRLRFILGSYELIIPYS